MLSGLERSRWPTAIIAFNDLMALGFSGKAIGSTLNALLSQVLDEQLPNEKQALLTAAKQMYPHNF